MASYVHSILWWATFIYHTVIWNTSMLYNSFVSSLENILFVDTLYFTGSIIHWWTIRFPLWNCCDYVCCDNSCEIGLCIYTGFHYSLLLLPLLSESSTPCAVSTSFLANKSLSLWNRARHWLNKMLERKKLWQKQHSGQLYAPSTFPRQENKLNNLPGFRITKDFLDKTGRSELIYNYFPSSM